MAEYLFKGTLDNTVHDISYEQIKQLYEDNKREEAEGRHITQSSYRGRATIQIRTFKRNFSRNFYIETR